MPDGEKATVVECNIMFGAILNWGEIAALYWVDGANA